jgi:N-methylhydantoinase B
LQPGDVVTIDAPGGGGYGNPLARDPELVLSDVIEGYVSRESAHADYGVVINPETFSIDWPATEKVRDR